MQHDRDVRPLSVSLLSEEELIGQYGDRLDGFNVVAQQLLTSKLPNKDYATILLEYVKDVDTV